MAISTDGETTDADAFLAQVYISRGGNLGVVVLVNRLPVTRAGNFSYGIMARKRI